MSSNRFKVVSFFQDPETVMRSYPEYEKISSDLQKLNTFSLQELLVFEDEFLAFRDYYCKCLGLRGQEDMVFQEDTIAIYERKKKLQIERNPIAKAYYENPVKFSGLRVQCNDTEYVLYDIDHSIMPFDSFEALVREQCTSTPISREKVKENLDTNLCSDWSKMDRKGVPYGGFWEYPEGTPERENAFVLSHQDNVEALLEMPFPYRLIYYVSAIHGCNNRMESPRYTFFFCYWVDQTIRNLSYLAEADMAVYEANCKH